MAAQRATVERARRNSEKIWKRCNYQGPQSALIYSAANGSSGAPNRAILKRLTQFFAGFCEVIAWRNLGFIQIDTTINFNLNGMLIC